MEMGELMLSLLSGGEEEEEEEKGVEKEEGLMLREEPSR